MDGESVGVDLMACYNSCSVCYKSVLSPATECEGCNPLLPPPVAVAPGPPMSAEEAVKFNWTNKVSMLYDTHSSEKSKYHREIVPGIWIDVYDVLAAFETKDAAFDHAIKKMLCPGKRGHKDEATDRKDIELSVKRSNEIYTQKNTS